MTVNQIATEAGVTQRTFFRHYPTKIDVLFADSRRRQQLFIETLHRQPRELSLHRQPRELSLHRQPRALSLHRQPRAPSLLDALCSAIADDEAQNPWTEQDATLARIVRESQTLSDARRSYESWLETVFADWIPDRNKSSSTDLTTRTTAAVLVAARRVIVGEWIANGSEHPVTELAASTLTIVGANLTDPFASTTEHDQAAI